MSVSVSVLLLTVDDHMIITLCKALFDILVHAEACSGIIADTI